MVLDGPGFDDGLTSDRLQEFRFHHVSTDEVYGSLGVSFYRNLIRHIEDRSGHDQRYALDASKISAQLGWELQENFTTGLRKTVSWYLANRQWCENVQKIYDGRRLGLREKR